MGNAYTSLTSGGNRSWDNPANWNPNGVPAVGDTFTIPSGSNVVIPDGVNAAFGRSPLSAPATTATVATNAGAVTSLPNGTYRLAYTFVDSNGVETGPGSSESAVFTVANSGTTGQARATLPNVSSVSGAVSINVYLTNTSATTSLSERLYCTGVTGTTLDLVSASWGNTVSSGQATGGSTAFASAAAMPPQFDGVVQGTLSVGATDGAGSPASLTMKGPLNVVATAGRLVAKAGTSFTFDSGGAASPTSQKYPCTIGNQALAIFGGTSSARCSVSSNAAGGNGYFNGSGSQTAQVQAGYTDFLRVGDSGQNFTLTTPGPSPGGCVLTNCTFNACGTVRFSDNGGNAVFRFENNVCTNTAGTTPLWIASSSAITTGTRTIKFSGFDKIVNLFGVQDFTIEDNAFGAAWSATGSVPPSSFKRNFVTWSQNNGAPNLSLIGNVSGIYFYPTGGTNPHFCTPSTAFTSLMIDSCLFEYGGTTADGDDVVLPSPSTASTYTIVRCIKLPNAAGVSSGTLFSGLGNTNCRVVCEHNTIHGGGGGDSSGGRIGETQASYAGQVLSMRGNLYWDTTPRGYVFYDMSASPALDAVTAANCDYNGLFNATSGSCTVNGSAVSVTGYRGLNVSGATLPGVHDVVGDPQFVANTRCLRTWGQERAGTDGSAAAAVAALLAYPTKVADLLDWVRAGFVVTNPAFVAPAGGGLAFPGDAATTDAAGNALGGTLGALAFQSTAATSYTLTGPASGKVGVASANFTVTPVGGVYTGTVTPNDGGAGGTFTPASLSWSNDATAKTFTYTPTTGGLRTVATTSSPALSDPAGVAYTATASTYALSGPATGVVGRPASFSVAPNGPYTGTVTLNDGGAGGAFSPAALTFTGSAAPQGFTYTPAAEGVASIGATSSPALSDPAAVTLTVSATPPPGPVAKRWFPGLARHRRTR